MPSTYKQEDMMNHRLLSEKWIDPRKCKGRPNYFDFSSHVEKVVIWTGPAWEPWDKEKVDEGMAGSETWAAYLAREFVRRGYRTYVFNDLRCDDKEKDTVYDPVFNADGMKIGDVVYRDHTMLLKDVAYEYIDHFICSRSTDPFHHSLHSGRHYVMVHDIWLNGNPNYDIMNWKVQKYAYLSDWHKQFLIGHHKMPPEKMFLTANGVVQDLYIDVDSHEKKNQMIYSSSPDRGLYQLLQMMPEIRKAVPDFELLIAYGFFNWESAAEKRGDTASLELIAKIKSLMEQPGVRYLDRINKEELAKHQMESSVWLYPSWFTETFCIGAVENGLSKNAILTTDLAGLQTTVGEAGQLLSPQGLSRDGDYPKEFVEEFTEKSIALLQDEDLRQEWAQKAYDKMQAYRWENIVDEWIRQFRDPT